MCPAHRSVWVLASSGLHHDHLPCERLTQYRTDRHNEQKRRKVERISGATTTKRARKEKKKEEKKRRDKISTLPESNVKGREIIEEEASQAHTSNKDARTSCKVVSS